MMIPARFSTFLGFVVAFASIAACDKPELRPSTDLPTDEELRTMLDAALTYTYLERQLNLDDHAAWQILHGALPFGMHFEVNNGDDRVSAMQWVLDGNAMKGWTLAHGKKDLPGGRRGLKMVLESGTKTGQGHEDQWLAVMAQCGLPIDQTVKFQDKEYQLQDIVQQAMWDVYQGKEYSWTLIALVSYMEDLHAEWNGSDGQVWSVEKIMAMEAGQDLGQSACGGTHRLIGMSMALNEYKRQGNRLSENGNGTSDPTKVDGWQEAQAKIHEAIETAKRNQQPDGSFSTNYFSRPGTSPDLALRINTSGHTLEFLALALTDEQLKEPWVVRGVEQLCDMFQQTRRVNLECGSLYHAAHGLIEYRQRRFGPWPYPDAAP